MNYQFSIIEQRSAICVVIRQGKIAICIHRNWIHWTQVSSQDTSCI